MPDQKPPDRPGQMARQFALATELPFLLVGGVLGGGFLGFLLDHWLKTRPWGMLILGAVGFFVGIRQVLLRAGQGNDSDRDGSAKS
jgi:F0F1-type ATP synthase assembly protein I